MRFIVSDTREDAQAIIDRIDARAGELANKAGRGDVAGSLLGVNSVYKVVDLNAQRTTTWAYPRQRQDGKWVFSHPENSPFTADQVAYCLQDVASPAVEDYADDWFPVPVMPRGA